MGLLKYQQQVIPQVYCVIKFFGEPIFRRFSNWREWHIWTFGVWIQSGGKIERWQRRPEKRFPTSTFVRLKICVERHFPDFNFPGFGLFKSTPLLVFFPKNGPSQPLFHLFLSFQTNIIIFTTIICEKMSIQYMVLVFEPTTFKTCVSSHNH